MNSSPGETSAAIPSSRQDEQPTNPPVHWRELVAVLGLVVACDLLMYRGHGFAGYAALFVIAPILFLTGVTRPRFRVAIILVVAMLVLVSARLYWRGSTAQVIVGFVLLTAFAMSLSGRPVYMLELMAFVSGTLRAGFAGLCQYTNVATKLNSRIERTAWFAFGFPSMIFGIFAFVFVMANPSLLAKISRYPREVFVKLSQWIDQLVEGPTELLFWLVVLWISVGLIRPIMSVTINNRLASLLTPSLPTDRGERPSSYYAGFRNTLWTVVMLFAACLVFEFLTLWFREFPDGFYYAGYAHQGAAWLTVALALATFLLSMIFRGSVLSDPRLPVLRRLAWIWSVQNLLLAIAVYNRLSIYIGFNGMTRMRIVGLFGISTVVVGFGLVIWKLIRQRDFVWLVRSQLLTLAMAIYLLVLIPMDWWVTRCNVRRIMSGDPAPEFQRLIRNSLARSGKSVKTPSTET